MSNQPCLIEQYLHDIDFMEDAELEAKYYTSGIALPRYPVPAIPLAVIHMPDDVAIFEMQPYWTNGNCVYSLNFPIEVY